MSARATPLRVVVMGVSAAGKTTIARGIAGELGLDCVDADDLHPSANVEKMTAGVPLDDDDRAPWLDIVAGRLAPGNVVIACSALKRAYRDRLRAGAPGTVFIHLTGSPELLAERAGARVAHFMPATLLQSQLATLEPLQADEAGRVLDVAAPPGALVAAAVRWLRARDTQGTEIESS